MCFRYHYRKMVELFANNGDPDQMPHFVGSDLGLYSLPIIFLRGFQTKIGLAVNEICVDT